VLNRQRVIYRRSLAVALGASWALGAEPPRELFDEVTDSEQAAELARAAAEVRRRQAANPTPWTANGQH
jgi:hypothetical protein